jgi:beta-glucosidase
MTTLPGVGELLAALTLEEKAALTAGADDWSTVAVPRLAIPSIRLTDGPSGARGPTMSTATGGSTLCVPCGTALAASWDPALVARIGAAVGGEARAKGARMLLAPTVNLLRAPLAGRSFECYSEDPLLTSAIAVGYVRGVQSQGVAAVVKHLAGNEAETARTLLDSVIDERTLRELYLQPFEAAVREAGALAVMTGYNRLNGEWCAESEPLLAGVLRAEWGFDGLVMTDWWAVGSTAGSLRAGLDLQMPGPGRYYGAPVAQAVRDGAVDESRVDAAVTRLLTLIERLRANDETRAGDGAREHGVTLAREAAAAGMVLLHNDGLLPFDCLRSLAVLGPNADRAQIMGGGSSAVSPQHRTTPLAALRTRLPDVDLRYEPGCLIDRKLAALDASQLTAPGGEPGLAVAFYGGTDSAAFDSEPLAYATAESTRLLYLGSPATGVPAGGWSLRATGSFGPEVSGAYTISLTQVGRARLLIDGSVVLDGAGAPVGGGEDFFGIGSPELTTSLELSAGKRVALTIEFATGDLPLHGVHIGIRPPRPDDLMGRAVAAAAAADAVVLVAGTTDEWESEGFDRTSLALPGEQDELIRRVVAANPRTVVVLNCGAPVTMPWRADVAAILAVWFGGQEMAPALADVLTGAAEPGGRLPCTLPERLEHTPAYGNFPGEGSQVRYGEGLLVGYRWYDTRHLPVLFPFGHGLSYAGFAFGAPRLSAGTWRPGETLTVTVPVRNTADRPGSEVVQLYVAPQAPAVFRPDRELKAFGKVTLDAGESADMVLELTTRAFARWDTGNPEHDRLAARIAAAGAFAVSGQTREPGWRVDPGTYALHIGRSVADIAHVVSVEVSGRVGE